MQALLRKTSYKENMVCHHCHILYQVFPYLVSQTSFCSQECRWASRKGVPTWNKGIPADKDEKSHNWKGDSVGYSALHRWVRKKMGSANHCEDCGLDKIPKGKKRYFDWANISGQYKRSLEDWKQLCKKCHLSMDALARRKAKQ